MIETPLKGSIGVFLLGALIIIILAVPDILGSRDIDGDGISDTFQNVEDRTDLVLTPSGEWKEVNIGYRSETDLPFTAFIGTGLLVVLPLAVYYLMWEAPIKKKELGKRVSAFAMHDNVRRMASFLSTNPSLPNSARLSHVSQVGEGEKVLGQVLWSSRTTGSSLEGVLLEKARMLDDKVLESSVEGLISAERESTIEDVGRSCRSVVQRLGEDLKERMTSYSSSLKGPSTALFGLGVLLPVLLATMIPIAGFSNRTVLMIGVLLWVVVPVLILRTGRNLVLKRPMVKEGEGYGGISYRKDIFTLLGPLVGGLVSIASLVILTDSIAPPIILDGPFPDPPSSAVLALFIGSSAVFSSLIRGLIHEGSLKRSIIKDEAEKVPDLLSEIGSRLQEGRSFERALESGYRMISSKPPLRGSIPEGGGEFASSIRVAREYSRAGGRTGGSSIKALSSHLREMGRLERSLKEMIRSSIGQMEVTSSIFAPIMIGISVGIFELMGRSSDPLKGGELVGTSISGGELTVTGFILLSGVYLLILSVSTTLTMRRLEEGTPRGGWERVPRNLMLSSLTFTAGVVASALILGG